MLAFQESPVVDSPPSLLLGNCFDVMGAVPCSWVSAGIALPGEGSSGRGVPSHISHSHPQRVYSTVKISIRRWKSSPRCLLCSPLLPGFVSPGFYNRGLRASRVASVQLPKSSESRRAAGGCFRTPKPTSFSVIHVPSLQPPPLEVLMQSVPFFHPLHLDPGRSAGHLRGGFGVSFLSPVAVRGCMPCIPLHARWFIPSFQLKSKLCITSSPLRCNAGVGIKV